MVKILHSLNITYDFQFICRKVDSKKVTIPLPLSKIISMSIKSWVVKQVASYTRKKLLRNATNAVNDQMSILRDILEKAKHTKFGKDHHFDKIKNHQDFIAHVPIREYEDLKKYFDAIAEGTPDVTWPGKPKYLAKTSGTTSGVKYIPITHDSLPNHIQTARNAILNHMTQSGSYDLFDASVIFLSGSPVLEKKGGIPTGRLSGIVNHEIPWWLKLNQVPSFQTNSIEDWETKLQSIIQETKEKDLRIISGIPPWVQMYFENLLQITGQPNIKKIFPNLGLFIYGGVNYEPYRPKLESLMGFSVPSLETYPASEGFIAFQDGLKNEGLLLNTNSGIFYEFVPLNKIFSDPTARYTLAEVELGVDYALIISSNAGLWGYSIGDCVRFVSLHPYRIVVTGRVKHFISAFGEHVIGKEVEEAMILVSKKYQVSIVEYTVAPQVNPTHGLPYHEWLVEFADNPADLENFEKDLDQEMTRQNIYYRDLIEGKILRPLVITPIKRDGFRAYMKSQGKLGGQNKVPRLSDNRKIADAMKDFYLPRPAEIQES